MSDRDPPWFISVLDKLTWARVVLAIAAGLSGLILLYVYENRATQIPALLSNNLAMFGLMLSLLLGVLSAVGSHMIRTFQARTEAAEAALRETMTRELASVREGLAACAAREASHQLERHVMAVEIEKMRRWIHRATAVMKQAGLNTDFGDGV